jgi:hypothetical protein
MIHTLHVCWCVVAAQCTTWYALTSATWTGVVGGELPKHAVHAEESITLSYIKLSKSIKC